ncbi:hypothetical protein NHQ30_011312 [Ciborinia camelliae]|nr:hypothetical protein NHQ30_011312 [Ciborinia camelliae]
MPSAVFIDRDNKRLRASPRAKDSGELLQKRGTCEFPTDAGLVAARGAIRRSFKEMALTHLLSIPHGTPNPTELTPNTHSCQNMDDPISFLQSYIQNTNIPKRSIKISTLVHVPVVPEDGFDDLPIFPPFEFQHGLGGIGTFELLVKRLGDCRVRRDMIRGPFEDVCVRDLSSSSSSSRSGRLNKK